MFLSEKLLSLGSKAYDTTAQLVTNVWEEQLYVKYIWWEDHILRLITFLIKWLRIKLTAVVDIPANLEQGRQKIGIASLKCSSF